MAEQKSENRLVVHVGLPKTATTALQQHAFPTVASKGWQYIGVRQPRNSSQAFLYTSLMDAVNANEDAFQELKTIARNNLAGALKDRPVFWSDEMLLVDTRIPWQQKMDRLGELLNGFSPRVLVTLRDPAKAVFSLFVQQWKRYGQDFEDVYRFSRESNQALIFQYQKLVSKLEANFDSKELKLVVFGQTGSKEYLKSIEEALEIEFGIDDLPFENRKVRQSGYVLTEGSSLGSRIKYLLHRSRLSVLIKTIRPVLRPVASLAKPLLQLRIPESVQQIPEPDYSQLELEFNDSKQWLKTHYGIIFN